MTGLLRRVARANITLRVLLTIVVQSTPSIEGRAQELEPGAYSPAPTGANIVVVADSINSGDVTFDPSLPVTNGHANINAAATGYVRTFGFLGRSASIAVLEPYLRGNFEGLYLGQPENVHRAAFGDPSLRLAINLFGAPAMTPKEFGSYQPETVIGMSLVVVAPLGAYNSAQLINVGSNRWSFKPEVGVSRSSGPWTLEADAGAWLFTDNTDFAGGKVRAQDPIGSAQMHAIYTIQPRMWIALSGTFYVGGRTTINGMQNFDLQQNTRFGVTFALPLTQQQSVKLLYSRGAWTTVGADFQTVGIQYQYVWLDRPSTP